MPRSSSASLLTDFMNLAPRITIAGTGAVSAAGWGVPALLGAMDKGLPLPLDQIARPGLDPFRTLPVRRVPKPADRPADVMTAIRELASNCSARSMRRRLM